MIEELQKELQNRKNVSDTHIRALDEIRAKVAEGIPNFLATFFETESRKLVSEEPMVTQGLSPEALTEIKQRVKSLIADSQGITTKWMLTKNSYWPHLGRIPTDKSYHADGHSGPIRNAVAHAMGELASVLEPHGYLKGSGNDFGRWRRYGEREQRSNEPSYPYHIMLPEATEARLKEYTNIMNNLIEENNQIEFLKKQLVREQAASRWDEA